jgi:hypothetical protein
MSVFSLSVFLYQVLDAGTFLASPEVYRETKIRCMISSSTQMLDVSLNFRVVDDTSAITFGQCGLQFTVDSPEPVCPLDTHCPSTGSLARQGGLV